jgi:hypothetical protein
LGVSAIGLDIVSTFRKISTNRIKPRSDRAQKPHLVHRLVEYRASLIMAIQSVTNPRHIGHLLGRRYGLDCRCGCPGVFGLEGAATERSTWVHEQIRMIPATDEPPIRISSL